MNRLSASWAPLCVVVLLLAGLVIPGNTAQADQRQPWANSHKNPTVKKAYDEEYHTDRMRVPIDLPNLPLYSGKSTFISGITFPRVKGGATINMRFATTDESQTVLNFYRSIFSQLPWTLDRAATVGTTIAALDSQGHIGEVTVLQSYKKGKQWHTEFIVLYKHTK